MPKCDRCKSAERAVRFTLCNMPGKREMDGDVLRWICSGCADDMFTEFDTLRRGSVGKLQRDKLSSAVEADLFRLQSIGNVEAGSFKDAEFDNPLDYDKSKE